MYPHHKRVQQQHHYRVLKGAGTSLKKSKEKYVLFNTSKYKALSKYIILDIVSSTGFR